MSLSWKVMGNEVHCTKYIQYQQLFFREQKSKNSGSSSWLLKTKGQVCPGKPFKNVKLCEP